MTRKAKCEPDQAAIDRIRERLDDIARRTKWSDPAARSRAIQEIEELNREILDARNVRPRYRADIPRIRKLYSMRITKERSPGPPVEFIEFPTTASWIMQDLEDAHGMFPLELRMNIYRAMIFSYLSAFTGQIWRDGQDRKRASDRLNDTKRKIRSLDERDAAIVAEWQALAKDMPGKGQRDERLAEKYGLECARSVFNIRRKAGVK